VANTLGISKPVRKRVKRLLWLHEKLMENLHQPDYSFDWISSHWPLWKRSIPDYGSFDVLEIGAFEGKSTVWFLENYPFCEVTCIDTFEGGLDHKQLGLDFSDVERKFRHNTKPWADRVTLRKGKSADWLRTFSTQLQFHVVLVDGSHLACDVLTDAVLAWPLLAPTGIMIFDDMGWGTDRPPHERPAPAIDAFLTCYHGQYELLERGYQAIVRKL
jgi:hypothetical protein